MEPPSKRQKVNSARNLNASTISSSSTTSSPLVDSYQPQAQNEDVAMAENNINVDVTMEVKSEAEREQDAGILCFVNAENPGFRGILKQRYTDFQVNEIQPGGAIVHLTNDRAPRVERAALVATQTRDANQVSSSASTPAEPTTSNNTTAGAEVATAGSGTPVAGAIVNISDNSRELLVEYFGEDLAAKVIELDAKIQARPTAAPSNFDQLESPFFERDVRGRVHGAIRRIFNSRIDTRATEMGKIELFAAPKSVRAGQGGPNSYHQRGNPDRNENQNPRQQGQRGQQPSKMDWQQLGGEYLHFTLYKENKDTMEVMSYIAKGLRMNARDFNFAGTKDRRAVTCQRMSVRRQNANTLARLNANGNLRQAVLGDFKHEKHPLQLGELEGNLFTVALRDCQFGGDADGVDARLEIGKQVVGQAFHHLQEHGFLNYFGLQRFGTFNVGTEEIGTKILKGDFEGAVDGILYYSEDALLASRSTEPHTTTGIGKDDIARALAIKAFRQTGSFRGPDCESMPRKFNAERSIMLHLSGAKSKKDFQGALNMVYRNLRTMYVHAYQSLVWNSVASERWNKYGDKVVKGDLVIVDIQSAVSAPNDEVDENGEIVVHPAADDRAVNQDEVFERARPLSAEEAESGKYKIFDVVLPLPGYDVEYPDNDIGDYYKTFMSSERGGGLDPANMRRQQKDYSLSGSYRKLIAKIGKDFSFELKKYYGANEDLIESDWEKIKKARFPTGMPQQNPRPYNSHRPGDGRTNVGDVRNGNHGDVRVQNVMPIPPRSAPQVLSPEARTDAISAWKALPNKLAVDEKAAAIAAEKERDNAGPIDFSKLPKYTETFIQTSAENEGRRTGLRSTAIIDATGAIVVEPTRDVTVAELAASTPSSDSIVNTLSQGLKDRPDALAILERLTAKVKAESAVSATAAATSVSTAGPAAIAEAPTPREIEPAPAVVDTVMENTNDSSIQLPEVSNSGNQISAAGSKVQQQDATEPEPEPEPAAAKIAVIVKFTLGTSQYCTMALRELMKAGGFQQYKPDFSGGRGF